MKKAKPFPTLLTKSDAMLFAAQKLDELVGDLGLIDILKTVIEKPDFKMDSPEDEAKTQQLREMASGIVDVQLQRKAMEAAAAEIRARANEIKLVEALAAEKAA